MDLIQLQNLCEALFLIEESNPKHRK
jgi:hypothetical protein